MAEKEDEGKKAVPPAQEDKTKDERGVEWKNVAMEYKRKYEELGGEVEKIKGYLLAKEKESEPEPSEKQVERVRAEKLRLLVADPDAYIAAEVQKREQAVMESKMREEAAEAAKWIRSQKEYTPELEQELMAIINEYTLAGTPKKRAEAAWTILRHKRPEIFHKVETGNTRDKELRRFTVEGPGRSVGKATPYESKRKELLEQLRKAKDFREQAQISGELSRLQFEERNK